MDEKDIINKILGNQELKNLIGAVEKPEFLKTYNLIGKYDSKRDFFYKIYQDYDDVRVMFFTKIINTLYSYFLERTLINGLVAEDPNVKQYLKNTGLATIIDNWDTFSRSHNFYNSHICYIRIFSCLESSLREIFYYLKLDKTANIKTNFINFYTIYKTIIDTYKLNPDYKNLLELLSTIRNLTHDMGVSAVTKDITYKNKTYSFVKGQFPSPDVLDMINLLDLYENDIVDFITELFECRDIKQISNIPDNLTSNSKYFEMWLADQN